MRSSASERSIAGVLPAFWPGLDVLALARRRGGLALRDDLPFDPAGGLHRARLPSSAGETWITLPVRRATAGAPLATITLAPPATWAPRAMRAIEHAFADAPYFESYRCELARLLFHGWQHLVDLDLAMLRFLLRSYALPDRVMRASDLASTPPPLPAGARFPHEDVADRPALEALLRHGPARRPGRQPERPLASRAPSARAEARAWADTACR